MKIFQRKKLSVLLAGLFCFMSVMQSALPVRADGENDPVEPVESDGIIYEWDGYNFFGHVDSGFAGTSISIPADCHLVMDDESGENHLSGATVSIASGAYLEIRGGASFEGTIDPSNGAILQFDGQGNVPDGLTLYEDDSTPFSDATNIWKYSFCYDGDSDKWLAEFITGPATVVIAFGGLDPASDTVTIEYKFEGESEDDYRPASDYNPEEDPDFPGNFQGEFVISDGVNNEVDIRVTLSSTRSAVFLAADNGADDLSSGISGDGSEFTMNFTCGWWQWYGISLGYADSGNPEIAEKACEYLYAYCPTGGKTVKDLFAEELVCRLMDPSLFEYFGMPEITGNDQERAATRAGNVTEMATNRITEDGDPYSVTAKDTHGNNVNIAVQNYKVTWGCSDVDGSEVSCILPVYTLENINQVLICTDFNAEDGSGSTFFICDITQDEIGFTDDLQAWAGGILFRVDSLNPDTVKTGGMGRMEIVLNDEGLCTIEVNGGAPASYLRVTDPVQNGSRIRFLKNSEKYVSVKGTGESKAYGLIGDNGSNIDDVWATGSSVNTVARVYVGDTTIHLYPLSGSNTGLSGTGILSVELVDAAQADGVTLDATDLSDITLTFNSNFYDEIPLKITFSGDIVKYLTIIRVGLVIQYLYLDGDPDHTNPSGDHGQINLDYRGTSLDFDYDYYAGEQVAVWATYYHPTNDPTGGAGDYLLYLTYDDGRDPEVLTADDSAHNFDGRVSATNQEVASTTFLIGFTQGRATFDGNVWIGQLNEIDFGGFSATVLNSGYDDNTTYGGTQMGSGRGVHWDGHISFYR